MFAQKLKDQDLFGHEIKLSFNSKGSEHKTMIGGCISLLIKAFFLFYMASLIYKLVLHLDDKITTVTQSQIYSDLGTVNFGDVETRPMILLFNTVTMQRIPYDHEARKYIRVRAKTYERKFDGPNSFTEHFNDLEVKDCEPEMYKDPVS